MLLHLLRISSTNESTIGALYMDGAFQCYTCEDPWKANKEAGTTRIHPGLYEVKLRKEGGMTKRYMDKFPEMHEGMLHLQDTPEFKWVYIHLGNTPEHSQGCILVGDLAKNNVTDGGFVGNSNNAYRRLYPEVAGAILGNEQVQIRISDLG